MHTRITRGRDYERERKNAVYSCSRTWAVLHWNARAMSKISKRAGFLCGVSVGVTSALF